jgi:hypothetical protein
MVAVLVICSSTVLVTFWAAGILDMMGTTCEVSGRVVDNNGLPIANASVISGRYSTSTSDGGQYHIKVMGFSPPAITASADGHWDQRIIIEAGAWTSGSSWMNFTLANDVQGLAPEAAVFFDVNTTHTALTILENASKIRVSGIGSGSPSYLVPVDPGVQETMNFTDGTIATSMIIDAQLTVTGTYSDIPGSFEIAGVSGGGNNRYSETQMQDYLDPSTVPGIRIFQNVSANSNFSFDISPYWDTGLKGPLGLHFSVDILGRNVSSALPVTMLGGREGIGRVHLELHNSDPIQHTYQLYAESGCVIHIWEMALSEPFPPGLYQDST